MRPDLIFFGVAKPISAMVQFDLNKRRARPVSRREPLLPAFALTTNAYGPTNSPRRQ